MTPNLVSIITPCFNASEYIKLTYDSLKSQTYTNWEWVVFDDCSTDNSSKIFEEICKNDKRVRFHKNLKNSGAAITRNNCLDKAEGEFLAFLDCDDLWLPRKLETQINFLRTSQTDFTYSNYEMIDNQENHIKTMCPPLVVSANDLLKNNPFATSSVMIKRKIVEKNSIRFLEHLRRRQDYLFWYAVISNSSPALGQDLTLSKYRIVGESSLSSNKKKMAIIQWNLYRNEFKLNLFKSIFYFTHYAIHGIKKYFLR